MCNLVDQKLYYNLSINLAHFKLVSNSKIKEQNYLNDPTTYLEQALNQIDFSHLEIISKSYLNQGSLLVQAHKNLEYLSAASFQQYCYQPKTYQVSLVQICLLLDSYFHFIQQTCQPYYSNFLKCFIFDLLVFTLYCLVFFQTYIGIRILSYS